MPDCESLLLKTRQEYTDFVYRVSHDFSAPLRTVTEFSRLLKEDHSAQLDEQGMLYLGLIVQAGEKMRGMFEGLLALSRLNTEPARLETVSLQALADELAMRYRGQASINIGRLPDVRADARQMRMLFMALLENAILFVPRGRKADVQVSALRENGFWRISIRDQGIGIAPDFHEDVFTVFRRLHKDTAYPGLGIGLALARRIIEIHGGRIWVESEEGHGADFKFTLPAA